MKTLTAEYDKDSGEYWVTTRLNGRYLGGQYRSKEEVEELGFNPEILEHQEIRI